MVTSTLLLFISLLDMVPVPNTSFIFFNMVSFTSVLFTIVVFEVVFVVPVLATLYPAPSNSLIAFCSFVAFPLPFNTSNLISVLLILLSALPSTTSPFSVVLSS